MVLRGWEISSFCKQLREERNTVSLLSKLKWNRPFKKSRTHRILLSLKKFFCLVPLPIQVPPLVLAQTTLTSLSVHLKEPGWPWAAEEKNKMTNLPPNLKKKKKTTFWIWGLSQSLCSNAFWYCYTQSSNYWWIGDHHLEIFKRNHTLPSNTL